MSFPRTSTSRSRTRHVSVNLQQRASLVYTAPQTCSQNTPQILRSKRLRETFPFAFKYQSPKLRSESQEWLQRVAKRFDNKKGETQNVKLNYGQRFKQKPTSYIDGYRQQQVQTEQLKQNKLVHKQMKADHLNEGKLYI